MAPLRSSDSTMLVEYPVSYPRMMGPRKPPRASARSIGIEAAMMHNPDSTLPRAISGTLPPWVHCQRLRGPHRSRESGGDGKGELGLLGSMPPTLGIVVAFTAAAAPALV